MQTAKCPHCKEDLDRLFYQAEVTEYGACDLAGDNSDCDNGNTNDVIYSCPECEKEVNLEDFEEKEDEEEVPTMGSFDKNGDSNTWDK